MQITVDVQDEDEATAVRLMLAERRRQDRKFGKQDHDPAWWMVIMGEEFGETCEAVCEYRWSEAGPSNKTRMQRIQHAIDEASQVSAVGIAMIQSIMRAAWKDEITTALPSDKRQVAIALDWSDEQIKYDEPDAEPMPSTEEIIRLGEESIKKNHPSLWEEMENEKRISRADADADR